MIDPVSHLGEGTKHVLDTISVFAVIGTLAQILPPIAALFTILWLSMQMFSWIEARLEKRKTPSE